MIKHTSFTILVLCFLMQLHLSAQDVGIGISSPSARLDVRGDPSLTSTIINSKVNYVGNLDILAVNGTSVTNPGFGIGGQFTGGYKGVDAICNGGNYSGVALYGLYGNATGTAGVRVGAYGT